MIRTGRLIVALAALLLLGLGFAACGDDDPDAASTVTETETVDGSAPTTTTTGGGDGDAPPSDREVTELTPFTSPSGNIGCHIERSSVRCDIAERDWDPPRPPKSCDFDWGQGIALSAGGAPAFVCAGDSALGAGEPLPYGDSIAAGLLRCESEESGMTCRDIETGRGFTISRQAYDLF